MSREFKNERTTRVSIVSKIQGLEFIEKQIHLDKRGKLQKTYAEEFLNSLNFEFALREVFFTSSIKNVFRGFHLQFGCHSASKIISVIRGEIIEYVLDFRKPNDVKLMVIKMSEESKFSLYIPIGVAHGYLVCRDETVINYLQDEKFCERCDIGVNAKEILAAVGIVSDSLILSDKDICLPSYNEIELAQ
jgi:dTDP-4-dehydrorhamnose 3,5-epimerase